VVVVFFLPGAGFMLLERSRSSSSPCCGGRRGWSRRWRLPRC
jgi:hypothetical protein